MLLKVFKQMHLSRTEG